VVLSCSKISRGLENFEKNTGSAHPAAKKVQKRATGAVALTDDQDGALWQGAISVGTPATSFTGKYRRHSLQPNS
jgi:cathepsin D